MIIPPDPEKDPRLFQASSSTPSLLIPSDSDISDPTNHVYGYPFHDDAAVDALPPYERRRELVAATPLPGANITIRPVSIGSGFEESDGSITPTRSNIGIGEGSGSGSGNSTRIPNSTGSGPAWQSASSGWGKRWKGKGRAIMIDEKDSLSTASSRKSRWWRKYKKWVFGAVLAGIIGIGLMVGLLAGLRGRYKEEMVQAQSGPAWHDVEPGDSRWNLAWADGSMNLTWTKGRDNPPASDGKLIECNTFIPYNTSDPSTNFTTLFTPYPSNKLLISTYRIPLQRLNMSNSPPSVILPPETNNTGNATISNATLSNGTISSIRAAAVALNMSTYPLGLVSQLPIFSRGIASTGTVEFVGKDASQEVINGGEEGNIRIDVAVMYGGVQGVEGIMRVCEVMNGSNPGVGIYTPQVTDGKISNPYSLDPTQLPSYHIVVRFPPSLFPSSSPSGAASSSSKISPIYIADMQMTLEGMGVRVGDLSGIVNFGTWNITSERGGAVVDYVAAERIWVQTAENAVRGRFNVSKSLYINSTDSSIMADIILHDPTSTMNTTLPGPYMSARALHTNVTATSNSTILPIPHRINTTFHTSNGLIKLRYLSHPLGTSLSSWSSLSSGEMDISIHPNYIGPFGIKNAWGSVRLPPPTSRIYDDPLGKGRWRAIVQGGINILDGSMFSKAGMNQTLLSMSGTTITGAAYWQVGSNGTLSPVAVQEGEESGGNEIVALGGWGDVTLRFDGT